MARAQGQIIAKGEGRWRIRWFRGLRTDGRRDYASETVYGTKKQAAKALREKMGRQDRGIAAPSRSSIPLLREQVEAWKESQAAARLRARTRSDRVEMLARHVTPKLGHLRLDTIHTATIEREVVGPLVARGCHRSAQLAVAALSAIYRDALKDPTLGLNGNPCRGATVGKGKRAEVRPLTAEERKAFRGAIAGTDHECLWLLMLLTGLGPGEALGLGWEHLDLDAGMLRVARTLDTRAGVLVDDAKRESRKRVVPLVPERRAMLRERWMAAGRPSAGLLFADSTGRPLDLHNLRQRHFRPAVERAGIKRRIRIYDLRHTFCTVALESGVDPLAVARLMGHSSTAMVFNVYGHVSDTRKREAADRIGEALLGG
jgi:integrase